MEKTSSAIAAETTALIPKIKDLLERSDEKSSGNDVNFMSIIKKLKERKAKKRNG